MAKGEITLNREPVLPSAILKVDDVMHTVRNDVQEPDVNAGYEIIYEADGLLVVNKPAPLPVHPAGRFYKNSLTYILQEQFPEKNFHTIHRLDLLTTGVLVLATDPKMAGVVHRQMDRHQVSKVYGVLAVGDFGDKEFVIDAPIGRLQGNRRGVGETITEAKPATTRFTPIAKNGDVTLLKAEPITGRTNQIRVHVQAAGGHVLGDPLYGAARELRAQHLPEENGEQIKTKFIGLHCRAMSFSLAHNESPREFVASWPEHFLKYFGNELF